MKNKIVGIFICMLFIGAGVLPNITGNRVIVSTKTKDVTTTTDVSASSSFIGYFGLRPQGEANATGRITGQLSSKSFWVRVRFNGSWATLDGNYSGTMRGIYRWHFLFPQYSGYIILGRVSLMVNGTMRSLPIIGFVEYRKSLFWGQITSIVGPVMYFWGHYN